LFLSRVVGSLESNAVKGEHSINSALQTLLKGTTLTGNLTERGVIIVTDPSALQKLGKGRNNMKVNTRTARQKTLLATLVGVFATGGAVSVQGQVTENASMQGRIDEVVVTAQKREQNLMDVPISISVVSGEALNNADIQNLRDLSFSVPNLWVTEFSPGNQVVSIRGVGNRQGSSSTVGIYMDDIPTSSNAWASLDLHIVDLQRVEVLKGPQGTLYGQGSLGGTIRYITVDPSFEGVEGSFELSGYNTHKGGGSEELKGVINIPVIDDVLAFRVSGTYNNESGWIDQPLAGLQDINDSELSNIRIKGLWQPAEALTIESTVIRHRHNFGGNPYANSGNNSKSNFQHSIFPTEPTSGGISEYNLYNLTVSYDFGFATLSSISSSVEQIILQEDSFFSEYSGVESLNTGAENTSDVLTQDIRLVSNGDSVFSWTAGIFLNERKRFGTNVDAFRRLNFDDATLINWGPFPAEEEFESIAYYGDISYDFSEQITVGLGARYFDEDQTARYSWEGFTLREASFDDLSLRAYLNYSLGDNTTVYGSVAEGFRSGGFTWHLASIPEYDPEQLIAYEFGMKSSLWDKRLNTDISIFYSAYEDYIATRIDPFVGNDISGNAGEAVIKGIEWNISWLVYEQLSIGFNGAFTDTEFTDVGDANLPLYNEGDQIPFSVEYSYSISAAYRFNWSPEASGSFQVSYNHIGPSIETDRKLLTIEGTRGAVDESDVLNFLNAQLSVQFNQVGVELFGRNLLDEDSYVSTSLLGQLPQARPRTLGVKVNYDF
jgi:iron complex outermembrane receptor protein